MTERDSEDMSIPAFTDKTAPRAPFKPGSVPGAAWFNIETVFCHACPNPGAMLRSHGLHPEDGADLWAACVSAGLDREVATPETLASLADTFRAVDADGRGVLLTVDHAGVGERPDTRAAGWIKALHAEGGKLWAWIELTPYGHGLVDSAEFAFFSTEYDYRDFKRTEAGAEPQRLAGCTLTNGPRHPAQTPCTNMKTLQARACATQDNKNMNTDTEEKKTPATNTEPEDTPAAANSSGVASKGEEPAKNGDTPAPATPKGYAETGKEGATNTGTESAEEPAATNDDDLQPSDDLSAALVAVAELLGLPDSAKPTDLVDAVKALQRSNDELRTALAEANKDASMNGGTAANSIRYPHLRALNHRTRKATALTGATPNREVTVSVGHGTLAVNCQDKARVDYCTNAVTTAERALGRALTPAEYGRTWAKANKDYTQGVNR